jgi:hypothetical protein
MSSELIAALVSSLLPILITIIFAWMSSKNDQAKRRQVIEEAKQRIEIISAYVTSQSLVLGDPGELEAIKRTAANELYEIKSFLDGTLQTLQKSSEKEESYFQRFFLLYPLCSALARFFRVLFFIALVVSILWSIFISTIAFSADMVGDIGMAASVVVALIFMIPVLLVALVLRWMAIKNDKPRDAVVQAEAVPSV